MEGSSDCGRHGGQLLHESRLSELDVDDGPTRRRSSGSEQWRSSELGVVTAPALGARSNSTLINSENLLTEYIIPH
jgi:hypothetical protein